MGVGKREVDGREAGDAKGHVEIGVARSADHVGQLRGDGVDADQPAGAVRPAGHDPSPDPPYPLAPRHRVLALRRVHSEPPPDPRGSGIPSTKGVL